MAHIINNFIKGNCIAVREVASRNAKSILTYIDRRAQFGGYESTEEEDKVVIDDLKEGDSGFQQKMSDAQKSIMRDSIHSQKISRQQTINSDASFVQIQDTIKVQFDKNNESHSDSDIYNYNSEDELEQFLGGTKSSKQIKAKKFQVHQFRMQKRFQNTIFKKEDSEEQPIGNVFSDNDASFDDRSPEFKKK